MTLIKSLENNSYLETDDGISAGDSPRGYTLRHTASPIITVVLGEKRLRTQTSRFVDEYNSIDTCATIGSELSNNTNHVVDIIDGNTQGRLSISYIDRDA